MERTSSVNAKDDVPVAGGGALAVYRLCEGSPSVVAVHGVTANSHSWLAVARELSGRVSLLAPDLRGRGRSNGLTEPYGIAAHAQDMLAVLDHFSLERAVLVGHSLGAYVVARLAAEHPERVTALVFVDGGLTAPVAEDVDPQRFVEGFLGPTLARLRMRFGSREEYHAWWRRHPTFAAGDVEERSLVGFADHDLVGDEPSLRSSVSEEAVRGDAADMFTMGEPAHRLTVPVTLMCAPRGLLDDPNPVQPLDLVRPWSAQAPTQRRVLAVDDVNHYTIALGRRGAKAVAAAVDEAVRAGT